MCGSRPASLRDLEDQLFLVETAGLGAVLSHELFVRHGLQVSVDGEFICRRDGGLGANHPISLREVRQGVWDVAGGHWLGEWSGVGVDEISKSAQANGQVRQELAGVLDGDDGDRHCPDEVVAAQGRSALEVL